MSETATHDHARICFVVLPFWDRGAPPPDRLMSGYRWTQEDVDAHQQRLQKPQQGHSAPLTATIASQPKPSKHRSKKTVLEGITFDSAKEAKRWSELRLLEQVGAIRDLRRQVSFDLWACNGERVARYVADHVYWSVELGKQVIEDSKSEWTRKLPVYRIKAKLMAAQSQPITEV